MLCKYVIEKIDLGKQFYELKYAWSLNGELLMKMNYCTYSKIYIMTNIYLSCPILCEVELSSNS